MGKVIDLGNYQTEEIRRILKECGPGRLIYTLGYLSAELVDNDAAYRAVMRLTEIAQEQERLLDDVTKDLSPEQVDRIKAKLGKVSR